MKKAKKRPNCGKHTRRTAFVYRMRCGKGYVASIPCISGGYAEGKTRTEAIQNLRALIQRYLKTATAVPKDVRTYEVNMHGDGRVTFRNTQSHLRDLMASVQGLRTILEDRQTPMRVMTEDEFMLWWNDATRRTDD